MDKLKEMEEVEETSKQKASTFEKHVHTVLLTLVASGVIWSSSTMMSIKDSQSRMEEREKAKTETLNQMQTDIRAIQVNQQTANERLTKLEK